ncbi:MULTISPECIES: LacI family DNA-binding transcriptional regulator [Catenuloplanes]|uniref:LacI family transcriptional regulator/LacI family repressor for deo operon, udp, cdd, tsx, nupC, and nupG n=1 Tax=Catenuloplanes niger TaxID=587534 RepID=A0AAE3ZJX2_9ACTN|nr:LacI family DNA-binding transcriptional regulator [Catenuloplanes niger]MDR7320342.1 LacI family transcriptional regulator/LacI family repressor for deo operon, udp, cdd, tsx, nupC, and nupG [Catenuloplanes niger]
MATLADVAALAGYNKSTVSRALTRPEMVAPETLTRILTAADQLGYVLNRTASQLARGRTGLAAFVVPTLENAFFAPIIGGAQARAAASDLHLTVTVAPLETAAQVAALTRLASQVDGLILAAPRGDDTHVRAIGAAKPVVLVDREIPGLPSVVADTATAIGTVVAGLAERGHRRIAYLGGPAGSWQDPGRSASAREAAAAAGVELSVHGPFPATFAAGVASAEDVLGTGATAVVPYATALALGLMLALRGRGIHVPEDVVVSAETTVVDALGAPGIPAIDVDGEALGHAAMDLLTSAAPDTLRLPVRVSWSG